MGHESNASREQTGLRVLVITAVAAERDAVLRGLRGDARFDVVTGGVGPAASAASAAKALAAAGYGLVVSAGIGGGFPGRAEIGSLVVADAIVAADLGAETPEGFRSVDELGFGSSRIAVDASLAARLTEALQRAGLPAHTGPVLTVSTVTGTAATASELAARVPGAAAEAMEGFGVAAAARDRGLPVLELRAISNAVGPRDREAWRIKEALDALEAAGAILLEVLR
ncbi:futalosine hydrolase [Paenibacillus ehimensis]|uniref:Futalosine hydrolase n=1 Tax=Paenibacillus ehimensis TaxID=79264 RepID=A0ABT8VEK1_9BACL|nr:futalosine hydrolase [Paenibacillus ehimensis]MDO3679409.1 futalosine hydrolase [Paenibacillus ehimensis]